ncbi:MAG: hypothetical protein M9894_20935 [Planctomycetes bacterium]|nr:hypothetical protein [Planctomycetota bacterium]
MDDRLRDLERRARETGAPADEAAWLAERLRTGALPRERLELAASCGHAGACAALGRPAPLPVRDPGALEAWSAALLERWPDAYLRAVVAARRCLLMATRAERAPLVDVVLRGAVDDEAAREDALLWLVERWLDDPDDGRLRRIWEEAPLGDALGEHVLVLAADRSAFARETLARLDEPVAGWRRTRLVEALVRHARHRAFATPEQASERLHAAAAGAVARWALGGAAPD